MTRDAAAAVDFMSRFHPFDALDAKALNDLQASIDEARFQDGAAIYDVGHHVDVLWVVAGGEVELLSPEGDIVAHLRPGDTFGWRALRNDGVANQAARASGPDTLVYTLPAAVFEALLDTHASFRAFFQLRLSTPVAASGRTDASLIGISLSELMTANPVTVDPQTRVRAAAQRMADNHISCVLVVEDGLLVGLLTTGDVTSRVVSKGVDPDVAVGEIMTRDPFSLAPDASGFDAMLAMSSKGIGHLPITDNGRLVGIVTRTNLVRRQQVSAIYMIGDINRLEDTARLADVIDQVPQLLVHLVGSGVKSHDIGKVITSLSDALTVRLLTLAEDKFGPPPVPYLWLACGSQGRREQTSVSDQDNCLMLGASFEPSKHDDYFRQLAQFVSDGLDEAGYFYCPGDMMATNDRWRQPVDVWRGYFETWVHKPDPMAQMLASVMFDLRAIHGDMSLFDGLQERTLELASHNSIFRAHMAANSLKHTPPLGLFRGFALVRSGEHKDTLDLKHNGVVPVVDLARMYALEGAVRPVNTRERLLEAKNVGTVSAAGASDLIDAYDLICTIRLRHQARQIRDGEKPDNFLAPSRLSSFERNHLKDAFGIIKSLQSALGHGRSAG